MGEKFSAPQPSVGDAFRTILALWAILPGLVAGLWTWLTHGDRRRALNRATGLWGRQGVAAAGIRLRVEGSEYLSIRPALFTLNHQSGIDPILVCALLKENFVAVAKSGIRKNPILGPAFAFAGTVFVERGSGRESERALRPAVDACAQGLALAIAPEGTRSRGQDVGVFKKGFAHLAMATGVPLIPIVIHNAGQILPRGGFIMRRGEVFVQVLKPISTENWTSATLDAEVRALEERYRETLAANSP